ncbi:MAG: dihydrofolate reductase [Arenimonas sp.]
MQKISLIAALDSEFAIGRGNALPWHLPADLQRFKALTLNKTIVMGRKTAESLGRALPKRRNIVLSRTGYVPFDGMEVMSSFDDVLASCRDESELCVIGGGEIYKLALPFATHLYLTHVETEVVNADAFFPQVDFKKWLVMPQESHSVDEKHAFAFEFVDYQKHFT